MSARRWLLSAALVVLNVLGEARTYTTDTNLMHKAFGKLAETSSGCEVPETVDEDVDCLPADYDVVKNLPPRTVPPGVVCVFNRSDDFIYVCTSMGLWIQEHRPEAVKGTTLVHHRHKRSMWLIIILTRGGSRLLKDLGLMKKLLCLFLCKKRTSPVRRITMPRITCPRVKSPQHPLTGKSLKVTWQPPFASDSLEGPLQSVLLKGKPAGSIFEEGKHRIHYKTTNRRGLSAYCSVSFEVTVSRCSRPKWPWNGRMTCDDDEQVSGSVCTFTCNFGYKRVGVSQIMCLRQKWVGEVPTCVPKKCPPVPKINYGGYNCTTNNHEYKTICTMSCKRGFQSMGPSMILCNGTGVWTEPGSCKDYGVPSFPNGCVQDKHVLAGSRDQSVPVTWDDPAVEDNSNQRVTITYSHTKGAKYPLGRTVVVVSAKDKSANVMKCAFSIYVEAQVCKHPSKDQDMRGNMTVYSCPNGTSLGYSCSVSCNAGYPLVGATQVSCAKDPQTQKLHWTWPQNSVKPYCKSTSCPKLRKPLNGAIVCDSWGHGPLCSIMCNDKYDVPRRVPEQYVCGGSTGRWRPHGIVQDCIVQRKPKKMRLPAEMYYFSGSCPNNNTIKALGKKFINILSSSKLFLEECGVNVPDCKAEMVDVRCGDARDVTSGKGDKHVHKRNVEKNVVMDFKVEVGFTDLNFSMKFTTALYRKQLKNIGNAIDSVIQSGGLRLKGLQLKTNSFAPGIPTLACPAGTTVRFDKGTCAGCPTGTYFNTSTTECEDCPRGFYEDEGYSIRCKPCPKGLSTPQTATRSMDLCTETCKPGTFSDNGVVPCQPCPVGSYLNESGQMTCKICPAGYTTLESGLRSSSKCVAYDLRISPSRMTELGTVGVLDVSSYVINVHFWIFLHKGVSKADVLRLEQLSLSLIWKANRLKLGVGSDTLTIPGAMAINKWHHIIFMINPNKRELNVAVNGKMTLKHKSPYARKFLDNVALTANCNGADIVYSGLNVIDRSFSQEEINSFAQNCTASITKTIFISNREAGQIISPSRCDAFNACSSAPCGRHECVDTLEGYVCSCSDGYKGEICEIAPNFCENNLCKNKATCVSSHTNFTCKCAKGYTGPLCEDKIVHGTWSSWTKWSYCSKVCGGGNRNRTRICENHLPCEGQSIQEEDCNTKECRVCPSLKRAYGIVTNCTTTDDLTQCTIKCRDDLVFSEEPLHLYECGEKTGYSWNHQTEAHPEGRLPACTSVKPAKGYSIKRKVTLPTLPCSKDGTLSDSVAKQVSEHSADLACIKENLCKPKVKVPKCSDGRSRRSVGTSVTMTISATVNSDASLDLGKLINNNTMTLGMRKYLRTMLMFEQSAQEVVNNSETVFAVSVNGVKYRPDVKSAVTDVEVNCQPGEAESAGACSRCPPGTREKEGSCLMCPRGYFQEGFGATSCQLCSEGNTTPDAGAQSVYDCSINGKPDELPELPEEHTEETPPVVEKPNSDRTMIIVLSVLITAMIISVTVATIVWIFKMKKLPNGPVHWGESGRNKITPGNKEENEPELPPYQDVYIPSPPPYTAMDTLLPISTSVIRPNTASDVQLKVFSSENSPKMRSAASTQTSLGPSPSSSRESSRHPSPHRQSPTPSTTCSRSSSRSSSPARNLASKVNAQSKTSSCPSSPAFKNRAAAKEPSVTVVKNDLIPQASSPPVRGRPGPGHRVSESFRRTSDVVVPSVQRARSASPGKTGASRGNLSPTRHLESPTLRGIMSPPPPAIYTEPVPDSELPILSPVRRMNPYGPFTRSKSPGPVISSS